MIAYDVYITTNVSILIIETCTYFSIIDPVKTSYGRFTQYTVSGKGDIL